MNDPNHVSTNDLYNCTDIIAKTCCAAGARTPRSTSSNFALGQAAVNR